MSRIYLPLLAVIALAGCHRKEEEVAIMVPAEKPTSAAARTEAPAAPVRSPWPQEFIRVADLIHAYKASSDRLNGLGEPSQLSRAEGGYPYHQYQWNLKEEWNDPNDNEIMSAIKNIQMRAVVGARDGIVDAVDARLQIVGSHYEENLPSLQRTAEELDIVSGHYPGLYYDKEDVGYEIGGRYVVWAKYDLGNDVVCVLSGPYLGEPVQESSTTDYARGTKSSNVRRAADFSLDKAKLRNLYIGPSMKPFGGAIPEPLMPTFLSNTRRIPPDDSIEIPQWVRTMLNRWGKGKNATEVLWRTPAGTSIKLMLRYDNETELKALKEFVKMEIDKRIASKDASLDRLPEYLDVGESLRKNDGR